MNKKLFPIYFFLSIVASILMATKLLAQSSPDAIAVRVITNVNHLSPMAWYQKKFNNIGSLQSMEVDGYEAVRDGRTVYVNASNVENGNFYTNIYLISYNQESDSNTEDIFGRILNNWKFNSNIKATGVCSKDNNIKCVIDNDCVAGDGEAVSDNYCTHNPARPNDVIKAELIRDTKRLSQMADMRLIFENYKNKTGKYPDLNAGSYIPGKTISVWPSWHNTLAKALGAVLSEDPINKLGACPPNFNSKTCWDDKSRTFYDPNPSNNEFELPDDSHAYFVDVAQDRNTYNLCSVMESGVLSNEIGACDSSRVVITSPAAFHWSAGSWPVACDVTCGSAICGTGNITRTVQCLDSDNSLVDSANCKTMLKPSDTQECTVGIAGCTGGCGYSCLIGTNMGHAHLCSSDDIGLTADTNSALVNACSDPSDNTKKCEYICDSGYSLSNGFCNTDTSFVCGDPDPLNSIVCSGDDTGLVTNFTKKVVSVCSDPNDNTKKCEYICNSGYHLSGSVCVANCNSNGSCDSGETSANCSSDCLITSRSANCDTLTLPSGTISNSMSGGSITQTTNDGGSTWLPSTTYKFGPASSMLCNFKCSNADYIWDETSGVCKPPLTAAEICGAAYLQAYTSVPAGNLLCSSGFSPSAVSGSGPWTWTCTNGSVSASCNANKKINGICGSASNGLFVTSPSSNLCGPNISPSTVSTNANDKWAWTCYGQNGGSNAPCTANKDVACTAGFHSNGATCVADTCLGTIPSNAVKCGNVIPSGGGYYFVREDCTGTNSACDYGCVSGWSVPEINGPYSSPEVCEPDKRLTVVVNGTGKGMVYPSTPRGIDCGLGGMGGSDCTEMFVTNIQVSLSANTPDGSTFRGWSGCANTPNCVEKDFFDSNVCLRAADGCDDFMNTDKTITATFMSDVVLTINKNGTGSGVVYLADTTAGLLNCGSTCSGSYHYNQTAKLTYTADPGSAFTSWSGCKSLTADGGCLVTMDTAKSVTATFTAIPYLLTVTKTGAGSGSVATNLDSLAWAGNIGTVTYNYNDQVTLTPSANLGSAFAGWSGGGCSGTGNCTVSMTVAKNVTANFTLLPVTCTGFPTDLDPTKLGYKRNTATTIPQTALNTPNPVYVYNESPSAFECRYKCDTGYARVGTTGNCASANQTKQTACSGAFSTTVETNNSTGGLATFNQTSTDGGVTWMPTSKTWAYNTVVGECIYKCASGYARVGSACVASGQTRTTILCSGIVNSTTELKNDGGSNKFTQTSTDGGVTWTPTSKTWTYNTMLGECNYKCGTAYTRVGSVCVLTNQTKQISCSGAYSTPSETKNSTGGSSLFTQTSTDGGVTWTPTSKTWAYNAVVGECNYKCASGYTRVGSACVTSGQTRQTACGGSIPLSGLNNNNGLTTFNQTSTDGGVTWTPTSKTWAYNAVVGECNYKCASGYVSSGGVCTLVCDNDSSCDAGENATNCAADCKKVNQACTGLPINNIAVPNTATAITQTANGNNTFTPSLVYSYNNTGSTLNCNYKCAANYSWNGGACVKTYDWNTVAGSCTYTSGNSACGKGTQINTVQCKKYDGTIASDFLCTTAKPAMSQDCYGTNADNCIVEDAYCTPTVYDSGNRTFHCGTGDTSTWVNVGGGIFGLINGACKFGNLQNAIYSPWDLNPISYKCINSNYVWYAKTWGSCVYTSGNSTCGKGTMTSSGINIKCKNVTTNTDVADSNCKTTKPTLSKECYGANASGCIIEEAHCNETLNGASWYCLNPWVFDIFRTPSGPTVVPSTSCLRGGVPTITASTHNSNPIRYKCAIP